MSKTSKNTRRGRFRVRSFGRDIWERGMKFSKVCLAGFRRWFPWRRLALVAGSFVVVMLIWNFALRKVSSPRILELPQRNLAGYNQLPTDAQVTALSRLEAEVTALRKKVTSLARVKKKEQVVTFDPSMFQRPALGTVTQGMGWVSTGGEWRYHDGVDILAGEGTPVLAAADGMVTSVKSVPGLGTLISVAHGNGWESRYGHVQGVRVSSGQEIKVGTVLGSCSAKACGEAGGFHFSIYSKGQPVDPVGVISGLRQ